jgi:hypothetical protein
MRLSGGLIKSLKAFTKGGFLANFRLVVEFRNKLADIHDRIGAGKSRVIRRLLPTRQNEKLNKRINDTVFRELEKAADFVAKTFNRQ